MFILFDINFKAFYLHRIYTIIHVYRHYCHLKTLNWNVCTFAGFCLLIHIHVPFISEVLSVLSWWAVHAHLKNNDPGHLVIVPLYVGVSLLTVATTRKSTECHDVSPKCWVCLNMLSLFSSVLLVLQKINRSIFF